MPQVKLNLYAMLRKYAEGAASIDVEVEPGETVERVLTRLGVPIEHTRIVFINNRAAQLTDALSGGETVGVFPAVAGG